MIRSKKTIHALSLSSFLHLIAHIVAIWKQHLINLNPRNSGALKYMISTVNGTLNSVHKMFELLHSHIQLYMMPKEIMLKKFTAFILCQSSLRYLIEFNIVA